MCTWRNQLMMDQNTRQLMMVCKVQAQEVVKVLLGQVKGTASGRLDSTTTAMAPSWSVVQDKATPLVSSVAAWMLL
jgi:hypothetical protein